MTSLSIFGKGIVVLACACLCLLVTRPALAQDAASSNARPHRALLDLAIGYGYLDQSAMGEHRLSGGFTAAYLVPISDTKFDAGVRFEWNHLGVGPHSAYSLGEPVNQEQNSWTLALRIDWMQTDRLQPDPMAPAGDGATTFFAPYLFAGGGRAKFSPKQPYSPVTAFHVSATAFQAGIGINAGGGFEYELLGSRRMFGVSLGPELSIIRTFGSVDSTAVVFNFFKGGIVF